MHDEDEMRTAASVEVVDIDPGVVPLLLLLVAQHAVGLAHVLEHHLPPSRVGQHVVTGMATERSAATRLKDDSGLTSALAELSSLSPFLS